MPSVPSKKAYKAYKTTQHTTVQVFKRSVRRLNAIIGKLVVIPLSSNEWEMGEMGFKMGRFKDLKVSEKSVKNGSSGGSEWKNLTGVRVGAGSKTQWTGL